MEQYVLPGDSRVNFVASVEEEDVVNPIICIICQRNNKVPVTSKKIGRARMKRAVNINFGVASKRYQKYYRA